MSKVCVKVILQHLFFFLLCGLVRQAKARNLLVGFQVGKKNCEIFGDVNIKNVFTIKTNLRMLEFASRLRFNFLKSSFGGTRVDRNVVEHYADFLNCRILS